MKDHVTIYRDGRGVPHVETETPADMFWGQGFVHARDRGLQLLMMRIIGQGRICELLDDTDENLEVDLFFRRMNWSGEANTQLEQLSNHDKSFLAHYVDGINDAFSDKTPWEFKLVGYKPEPWEAADTILISRMLGYLTLSQSQAEVERLLLQLIQADVSDALLQPLFDNQLEAFDRDLLKQVRLSDTVVPPELFGQRVVGGMTASNNWVVSGARTESGNAMLANDPHLEVNRLPAVWCEVVLKCKDHYLMGGSIPGLPGVMMGRTKHLAWGATYTYMDAVDSWIEEIRDGNYMLDGEARSFKKREVFIKRKRNDDHYVAFYENEHGSLDGSPDQDGYLLTTRWASSDSGALSLKSIFGLLEVETAEQAMDVLGGIETAWNWVISDTQGNIAYQMSGRYPLRKEGASGLLPLPGWDSTNNWRGFADHRDLPRALNPEQGYFVTANNNLNRWGKLKPINMCLADHRARRVEDVIRGKEKLTVADMRAMQYALRSYQAEAYMAVLKPLLPDTPAGRILAEWDCRYASDSKGAALFERFYDALFLRIFGEGGMGPAVCEYLQRETGLAMDFYENIDKILLSEDSPWFGAQSRDAHFRAVLDAVLTAPFRSWGEVNKFTMSHILFGGKFPRFLGFDRGPFPMPGGRASVSQGTLYRYANRDSSFAASLRWIVDMGWDGLESNLPGGPSDRRFSRWYCSDLNNWRQGIYKRIAPDVAKRERF